MSDTLASRVLEALKNAGVRELIICPGGRNADFVNLASETPDFKVIWHFEERAAAFLALGRMQVSRHPVAVIVTSGTAAGELLPATMEAFYSGLPLVLVTADRPRRFRGSGAPQSAEQVGLLGIYAPLALDLEGEDPVSLPDALTLPAHLNVCLEDPKGASASGGVGEQPSNLSEFLDIAQEPLVVLGRLKPEDRLAAKQFLLKLNAPVYAEALSGLREEPDLQPLLVRLPEGLMQRWPFDGVLRLGRVPTHRIWRDLEDKYLPLPVLSISDLPFAGLGRPSTLIVESLDLALNIGVDERKCREDLLSERAEIELKLSEMLDAYPLSEPSLIREISRFILPGCSVFLGNSLPIRQWDLVADRVKKFEISASRGLNGIDGQISTFLGTCSSENENWAILGDLTTLYDLAGPWPFPQLERDIKATIITINNSGGHIFDRMFESRNFINSHEKSLEGMAQIWNLEYRAELVDAERSGLRLIEIRPDSAQTNSFWKAFGELTR